MKKSNAFLDITKSSDIIGLVTLSQKCFVESSKKGCVTKIEHLSGLNA